LKCAREGEHHFVYWLNKIVDRTFGRREWGEGWENSNKRYIYFRNNNQNIEKAGDALLKKTRSKAKSRLVQEGRTARLAFFHVYQGARKGLEIHNST